MPILVLSRYLGSATRERLRAREVDYLDLTGNAWFRRARRRFGVEIAADRVHPEYEGRIRAGRAEPAPTQAQGG